MILEKLFKCGCMSNITTLLLEYVVFSLKFSFTPIFLAEKDFGHKSPVVCIFSVGLFSYTSCNI